MIRRPQTILALLTLLNLLNYMDRLVVSAVLPKIQEELSISNFVGGLFATIFLIGYFLTSPLFGTLADRGARKGLIAFGVAVWSIATFASGLTHGMWGMLCARAFVGVGEASYATLAPTIIDDAAPPEKRGRWLAIFYVAMPIGSALGYLVGGFVESHWGWRSAFFVAGGPGLLLALACLFIVEPARRIALKKLPMIDAIKKLFVIPLYRRGVLGYCAYTAAVGGFSYWAPKFLFTRYGMPLGRANFIFGTLTVIAGAIGTAIGGGWADRMTRRFAGENKQINGWLHICGVGSLIGAPLAAACFLSPGPTPFFIFVFVCEIALFLNTSPINAVTLRSVPTELRASAMALSIFSIHLLGDLWSPPFVGWLADRLPIAAAMMTLPLALAVSAFVWWPRAREATDDVPQPPIVKLV